MSIVNQIVENVIFGNVANTEELVKKAINEGIDPLIIFDEGLRKGISTVGDKFGKGEIFLFDMSMAAEAMKAGMKILHPVLLNQKKSVKSLGKFVIATVAGDIHSLGKDLVAVMLETSGFEVINLGEDVATEKIVEAAKKFKPDIVGLSALVTATMPQQKIVIEALKNAGLRNKVKVMVGGAPVSERWSKEIGADGYAPDAITALRKARELLESKTLQKGAAN